jgi:hypothetical protein
MTHKALIVAPTTFRLVKATKVFCAGELKLKTHQLSSFGGNSHPPEIC